ncbi:RHS repeat-associated core domain-containing protein [Umboniibacter marinipuniceus]|nr:RHS repeat-associated core domain-containing protein [Umboniibacter marinipuniceus]
MERSNATSSSTYHYRRGYEYNSMGKVIKEFLYENPDLNTQPTMTFEYDYDGRGNLIAKREGGGEFSYQYDSKNRLITEIEPNGETTRYEYGAFDQVTKLTRGALITTYNYNGFGELVSEVSPVSGTTTYTYNAQGQIETVTRADGRKETFSYQSGTGRLWKHVINGAGTTELLYQRYYNQDGLLSQVDHYSAATLVTRKQYAYDDFGRVTRERMVIGSVTRDLSSEYSPTTGQLTRLTHPGGRKVEYTYDNGVYEWASKVEVINANSTYRRVAASDVNYNPFGQIEGYSMRGGGAQLKSYNGFGMLKQQSVLNSSGYATLSQSYSYQAGDPVRLVMATDHLSTNNSRWYHYGSNNQLTAVTGGNPMYPQVKDSIQYGTNGNIISRTGVSGTFSYNSYGQLQSAGNKSFGYNSIGNVTSTRFPNGVTGALEYDARGLTNRYTWSGNDVRLTRDESNQLVQLKNGSQSDYFTFVGANLLSHWDESKTKHIDYIYLNGQLLSVHNTNTFRHIATGHLGQPVGMFKDVAATDLVWRGVHNGYDIEETTTTESLHVKFPGQYDIIGNGLYFNYHRDYDPSIGRYLQSDPIGNAGGVNTYAYTNGNPVMMVDPWGWCPDNLAPFHLIAEEFPTWWGGSETEDLRSGIQASAEIGAVPFKILRAPQAAMDASEMYLYYSNGDWQNFTMKGLELLAGKTAGEYVRRGLDGGETAQEAASYGAGKFTEQVIENDCSCEGVDGL